MVNARMLYGKMGNFNKKLKALKTNNETVNNLTGCAVPTASNSGNTPRRLGMAGAPRGIAPYKIPLKSTPSAQSLRICYAIRFTTAALYSNHVSDLLLNFSYLK